MKLKVGESFIIKPNLPALGVGFLFDFHDITIGESDETYFKKEFRYSSNGITYSDWQTISNSSLSSVLLKENGFIDVEFRYTVVGNEGCPLGFVMCSVKASHTKPEIPTEFKESFLNSQVRIDEQDSLYWAINVLKKVYEKGIVPDFIDRTEDYIDFFFAITHWFSLIVNYARGVVKIEESQSLLEEYLLQRDLIIPKGGSLFDLTNTMENVFSFFRKRGTSLKGNSEIRALLGGDIYIQSLIEEHKRGFHVGRSSLLYRGTEGMINPILAYEGRIGVKYPEYYPIPSNVVVFPDYIRISSGLGSDYGYTVFDHTEDPIEIDPRLDYLVEFRFKVNTYGYDPLAFKFFVDCANEEWDIGFVEAVDGTQSNHFIDEDDFEFRKMDTYNLRAVIFNYEKEYLPIEEAITNIGFGKNLKFKQGAKYIYFGATIATEGLDQGWFELYEFKLRPLMLDRPLGFVSISNPITLWLEEKNQELSRAEVVDKMIEKFIPYNSTLFPIWIDEAIESEKSPLVILGVVVKNITCFDLDNGEITIQASGGTFPYEYSIDNVNFQESNSFKNLTNGSFTPAVLDDDGVKIVGTPVQVTRPPKITITGVIPSDASIYGQSNGSILINATGGTPPLIYSLKKGSGAWGVWQSLNVFIGLGIGSYTVRVSDSNECTPELSYSITINQPPQLKINSTPKTDITCYGLTNGSITINVSSGVPPYQFRLGTGSWKSSNVFTGLSHGSYTPWAKDSTGYTVSAAAVSIIRPAQLVITGVTIVDASVYGASDGKITVSAAGGTGAKQYSYREISFALPWSNWQSSNVFTGLPAGAYLVKSKDSNGCETTYNKEVQISQPAQTTTTTTPRPTIKITIVKTGDGEAYDGINYFIENAPNDNGVFTVYVGDTITFRAIDNEMSPGGVFVNWEFPMGIMVYEKTHNYYIKSGSSNMTVYVKFIH